MADPSALTRASRRRALAVLLVAVTALVFAAVALRQRRHAVTVRTIERTTTIGTPNPVPLTDCAEVTQCNVGPASPEFVRRVTLWFPQAQMLGTSSASSTGASGHSYRQSADVRTSDGVLVGVSSRCVPGGVEVQDNVYPPGSLTVGPVQVVITAGPVQWDVDVGCSVSVVLDVPAGVAVPLRAGDGLAHDPAVASKP